MTIHYVYDKPLQYGIDPGESVRIGQMGNLNLLHFIEFLHPLNVRLGNEQGTVSFVVAVDGSWGVYVPAVLVSELAPRLVEIMPYCGCNDGWGRDLLHHLYEDIDGEKYGGGSI